MSNEDLTRRVERIESQNQEIIRLLTTPRTSADEFPVGIDEASRLVGKSKPTLYRYVSEKRIPYHQRGRHLYFFPSDLLAWIKNGKSEELDRWKQ